MHALAIDCVLNIENETVLELVRLEAALSISKIRMPVSPSTSENTRQNTLHTKRSIAKMHNSAGWLWRTLAAQSIGTTGSNSDEQLVSKAKVQRKTTEGNMSEGDRAKLIIKAQKS